VLELEVLVRFGNADCALEFVRRAARRFDVDQVLEEVGTVTGSAASDKVEQLRKIQGVKDVSPDHPVTMS